jgi:transcriptional regulator with XRE-family HTH domain
MDRLRIAFLRALGLHRMSQSQFARKAGMTQSAITKFTQGSVPQDKLFRAIFQNWPDEETPRRLLREHIADEAERAGMDPASLNVPWLSADEGLSADLAVIARAMRAEPTLREFIRRTAEMFMSAERPGAAAAEREAKEVASDSRREA